MRKKILFINCSDGGSTGCIIKDITKLLNNQEWESYLCVPRITSDISIFKEVFETSMKYEQDIYYRISRCICNPLGFAPLSTYRIKRTIYKVRPDIIHIHCINSFMCNVYSLLQFIKEVGIPTVITNHAEFYYTGSCSHANDCNQWIAGCKMCTQLKKTSFAGKYWNKMKQVFTDFDKCVVTSVSPWVNSRSSASRIMEGVPQMVIENGVDTSIFFPHDSITLRQFLNIGPNTKIVLHVTALYSTAPGHSKGGIYIKELASRFAGEDVLFLVVGNHYETSSANNVRLFGRIASRVELALYYSLADITVLTSLRETFSMPLAESLCCGTPVVGFEAGGPESIALQDYTFFCKYGDVDELEKMLRDDGLKMKDTFGLRISRDAKEKYDSHVMVDKYANLYSKLLSI